MTKKGNKKEQNKKEKETTKKSKQIQELEKQTNTKINGIKTLYKAFQTITNETTTNNDLITQFKKIAEKEYKKTIRIVEGRIIDTNEQTTYRKWLQIHEKDKWTNIDIIGARLDKKLPYGELLNSKTYMIHDIEE